MLLISMLSWPNYFLDLSIFLLSPFISRIKSIKGLFVLMRRLDGEDGRSTEIV